MHRLPWLDRILLLLVIPVWLVALVLHIRQVWKGELSHVAFYVAAPSSEVDYPTVTAFWPGERATAAEYAVGDRLIALNDIDLAGIGPYQFFARALAELAHARRHRDGNVTVRYLRGAAQHEAELPLIPAQFPWRMLPLTAAFAVTGVLVLLRLPATRLGRAFFLGATLFSLHWTWFFGGMPQVTYAWYCVFFCASGLMLPFMLRAASLFPDEVAPKGRLPRWPWLFVGYAPIVLTGSVGAPLPPKFGLPGIWLVNVLFIVALLGVLTRNYVRAGLEGRRQLRWGIFGMYVGLMPLLLASGVLLVKPGWWWLLDITASAEVIIPLSILVAIVRSNLYDIDRLITSAIAYTILSVLLLGGVLIVAPRIADLASDLVGLNPSVGTPVFSVIMAIALVVGQRFVGPLIDRFLFRERYDLDRGMQGLMTQLRSAGDVRGILQTVGDRLCQLFRPEHCTVYLQEKDEYVAAFTARTKGAAGRLERIAADHPLIVLAANAAGPLDVEDWVQRRRGRSITPAVRAALEATRAAVVMPIAEGEDVPGFLLLGAKRSGDAYSPADLALLTAVADTVSTNLDRIERQRRTAAGPVLIPRKYEMLGELGAGGMGAVYKVRHTALGTVQAMKILREHLATDEKLVERFRNEARFMAGLRHPNIVRVADFDQQGSLYYFVMEFVDGVSLGHMIRERGALPMPDVLRIGVQISEGLRVVHAQAKVHRDVKPANVLMEHGSGRAVVTDFGIAKAMQETRLTSTGEFFGTIKYCAPEQLRGETDVDSRTDIYSLGMVLFEMAVGRQFFAGMDEPQVLAAALRDADAYVLPPELPSSLHPIVARAIARDRARRYPDVAALIADLRALAEELAVELPAAHESPAVVINDISSVDSRALTEDPPGIGSGPDLSVTRNGSSMNGVTAADTDETASSWTAIPVEHKWRLIGAMTFATIGLLAILIAGWFLLARAQGW